jgi:hypothetical protein
VISNGRKQQRKFHNSLQVIQKRSYSTDKVFNLEVVRATYEEARGLAPLTTTPATVAQESICFCVEIIYSSRMKTLQPQRGLLAACCLAVAVWSPRESHAADVRGYSVLKGHFLNQTGPETVITDPDFAFSILASVDLTEFDLVTDGSFRLMGGNSNPMDNAGDSWLFLDSFSTDAELNAAYGWGLYGIDFTTVNDGSFSCDLTMPETPFPPAPRLMNFAEIQAIDASRQVTVTWDFSEPPLASDFVQLYVTLGHGIVLQSPDYGEPGAMDGTARSHVMLPFSLEPGVTYSLNIEITRPAFTNATCYPFGEGIAATFSSTSIDFTTLLLPVMRLTSKPVNGAFSLEVLSEPGRTVILQSSSDLLNWSNVATNTPSSSGTNVFNLPTPGTTGAFYRAAIP